MRPGRNRYACGRQGGASALSGGDANLGADFMPDFQTYEPSTVVLTDTERQFLEQFKGELAVSTDPVLSKYMTGKLLLALTQSGGFTLGRAWAIVRPTSTSTGPAARQRVALVSLTGRVPVAGGATVVAPCARAPAQKWGARASARNAVSGRVYVSRFL